MDIHFSSLEMAGIICVCVSFIVIPITALIDKIFNKNFTLFGIFSLFVLWPACIVFFALDMSIDAGTYTGEPYKTSILPVYNVEYEEAHYGFRYTTPDGVSFTLSPDSYDRMTFRFGQNVIQVMEDDELNPFCVERTYTVFGVFKKTTYDLYISKDDLETIMHESVQGHLDDRFEYEDEGES